MHTYIHTYIHAYTYMHTYIHTYIYMHTYIHTCIHIYVHTYIHTYVHTYIYMYTAHDCGVYCALFAQYAASAKLHRDPKVLEEFVTKETVSKWRTETQTLIKSLSVN